MTKSITQPKNFEQVYAYISDTHFNSYHFSEYVKALQHHDVDISLNKVDGQTLLGKAAEKLNQSAVEILLNLGADPSVHTKGESNADWTPIYWAAYSGKNAEVSLLTTTRVEIIDLILSHATYEEVNVASNELILVSSTPAAAMQLLIHGASPTSDILSRYTTQALNVLSNIIQHTPGQCLDICRLHPDTLSVLEDKYTISIEDIKSKAIQAIKDGHAPKMIAGNYTQFTHDALEAIAAELADPTNDAAIREFLDMSLHSDAKTYLESKVDFAKLSDNAAEKILKEGFDPIGEKSDVFTKNAREAVEKVQSMLEADQSLILYSNLHDRSFECIDIEKTEAIKLAAIKSLKDGTNPRTQDGQYTDHSDELIARIASEVKTDVAKWIAIKALDPATISKINAELEKMGSSIADLSQEIQIKLKQGDDLGLVDTDVASMVELTPNTNEAITVLYNALESDPTLLLRVTLGKNVKALAAIAHNGGIDDLVKNAICALIDREDLLLPGDQFITYTNNIYDILILHPKQMLYIRDENIAKIHVDLGDSKFAILKDAAIRAVKCGAHNKLPDHLETTFANSIFNGIIKNIQSDSTPNIKEGFTKDGISSLKMFAGGAKDIVAVIEKFAENISLVSSATLQPAEASATWADTLYSFFYAPQPTAKSTVDCAKAENATAEILVSSEAPLELAGQTAVSVESAQDNHI